MDERRKAPNWRKIVTVIIIIIIIL